MTTQKNSNPFLLHTKIIQFFLFFSLFTLPLLTDVKSITGQIEFYHQNGGQSVMTLNGTGLGIGTVPSSNLHIQGNAMISNQITIGECNGSSNFNLKGTFNLGFQSLNSNATLDDHSIVLVDSSSDNITITLPYAGNVTGRQYKIKKIWPDNHILIHGGGNLIDSCYNKILPAETSGFISLISGGKNWHVLECSSDITNWSPDLLCLQAWYDASDVTTITESSNVSIWADKSGNDYHFIQSDADRQPTTNTRSINDLNSIEFNSANNHWMQLDNSGGNILEAEVLSVVLWDKDGYYFDSDDSSTRAGIRRISNSHLVVSTGVGGSENTGFTLAAGQPYLLYHGFKSTGASWSAFGMAPTSLSKTYNGLNGITIGTWAGQNSAYLDGAISEIIVVTNLSNENRQLLEGYLAHKWGLNSSLPVTHPYYTYPP